MVTPGHGNAGALCSRLSERSWLLLLAYALLDLLVRYGYRPGRSILAYLVIVGGFALTYHSLGDPQSILAAGEVVVGLLVEISFIATFTQRFFAR